MSSFIGSLLTSIGDGNSAGSKPTVQSTSSTIIPHTIPRPASNKRKADADLTQNVVKTQRALRGDVVDGAVMGVVKEVTRPDVPQVQKMPERPKVPTPTPSQAPPRAIQISQPTCKTEEKRSMSPPTAGKHSVSSQRVTAPTLAAAALPAQGPEKPPPKKGSYKEILARASQAQARPAAGQITHKPMEKLSAKKELAMARAAKGKGQHPLKAGHKTWLVPRALDRDINKTARLEHPRDRIIAGEKELKVRPIPLYQGTAKSKTLPSYQGTIKPAAPKKASYSSEPEGPNRKSSKVASSRRDAYSDEDSDVDGYEENSEDFSDMDAGFDEVEDEDMEAGRIAKREDAAESRMLEEMARQKAARRNRERQLTARGY